MGLVYKARDLALAETVALKIVGGAGPGSEAIERFRSEARVARSIDHHNVCAIHQYGEEGDLFFIAMELVEGRDLRASIRENGPLVWEEGYDVVLQVVDGLEAIHAAGVIHRDLKSANIMRDARGRVRLMDFGIAKAQPEHGQQGITRTGQIVGSPEYMSPEQIQGRAIDRRSDLYALGVVTYELFTGRVPFRGDTPFTTMMRHVQEQPPLEGAPAALLPHALVPILRRLLAKSPDDRFSSCAELREALRDARERLASQPTDSIPLPVALGKGAAARQPSRPPGTSRRLGILAGAVAMPFIVAGAVLYRLERHPPSNSPERRELRSSEPIAVPPTLPPPSPEPPPRLASPSPTPPSTRRRELRADPLPALEPTRTPTPMPTHNPTPEASASPATIPTLPLTPPPPPPDATRFIRTEPACDGTRRTCPAPVYPIREAILGATGEVVLRVFVDAAGAVEKTETVSVRGGEAFEKAARAAVRKWRYRPGTDDGKPVSMVVLETIRFRPPERP
jgi:serine/threonine-protein kinase